MSSKRSKPNHKLILLFLTSILGAQAGTMIALPVSGVLADEISWESVFYFFGTLGVIWFIFWAYLCYDSPASHPRIIKVKRVFFKKI